MLLLLLLLLRRRPWLDAKAACGWIVRACWAQVDGVYERKGEKGGWNNLTLSGFCGVA